MSPTLNLVHFQSSFSSILPIFFVFSCTFSPWTSLYRPTYEREAKVLIFSLGFLDSHFILLSLWELIFKDCNLWFQFWMLLIFCYMLTLGNVWLSLYTKSLNLWHLGKNCIVAIGYVSMLIYFWQAMILTNLEWNLLEVN